jgi:DNA-binding transcriptional MerR regulator
MNDYQQIGEVAGQLDINPKTIRYYERIGLIPEPRRSESGYRLYTPEDVERIAFILRAKALEFSLEEIGEILALRERGEAPCPYVTQRIEGKIAVVEEKIAALRQLREELETLHEKASSLPAEQVAARGRFCHLIENRQLLELSELDEA